MKATSRILQYQVQAKSTHSVKRAWLWFDIGASWDTLRDARSYAEWKRENEPTQWNGTPFRIIRMVTTTTVVGKA